MTSEDKDPETVRDKSRGETLDFAGRIEKVLIGVIGPNAERPYSTISETSFTKVTRFVITSNEKQGIELYAKDDCQEHHAILTLQYNYQCSCPDLIAPLQVDQSNITVSTVRGHIPIFHYDYIRQPEGEIPTAHINVHASNDDAVRVMLACGIKNRGKERREKFLNQGFFPTFSTLHFPVGGNRFRPCLEDVLQMLVYEFGIDARPGWESAITEGRTRYRELQMRTLIRDFPDIAISQLKDMGAEITNGKNITDELPSAAFAQY